MTIFISYLVSARDSRISPRAEGLIRESRADTVFDGLFVGTI